MRYTVYAIRGKLGYIYKGITSNLDQRLEYHNKGLSRWTKNRGPFKLIFSREFDNKSEGLKFEKFLKSGKGREFLKKTVGV